MARVIWNRTEGGVEDYPIVERAILGRDAAAECRVDARGVSRRHARIEERGSTFYLADLGSTNGTCVNGQRISCEVALRTGDLIQIGTETLRFESEVVAPDSQSAVAATGAAETRSAFATEPLSRTLVEEDIASGARAGRIARLPERLPRDVGKFRLEEKLGQGGMGAVYRALDRDSNREVAVKFIRQNIGRKEAFLEYFHHREAVLAREIDHPNVTRIYEHGVEQDQHYISMQYVRGESLYQATKRRRLTPGEILEVLRQTACGLAAAHRQGVVHSDIKPANILLEEPEGAPGSEPMLGGEVPDADDSDDGILEFDIDDLAPSATHEARSGDDAKDPALLEEIRRRVGAVERPSQEVLVDPPYFERPSELRFLEHYVDRMAEGRGFFLMVEGETGTGKDRLVSEFLLRKRGAEGTLADPSRGIRFLELDCSRIEGIPLLYERFQPRVALAKQKLVQMVEGLEKRFEEDEHPTVIRVLEIGKANALVCRFLAHLAGLMPRKPLVAIASVDSEEIRQSDSLKVLMQTVEPVVKELYLRPMTEYQIQRYVEALFGEGLAAPGLASDLHRLSDGNFSRVLDLLRSFFERGVLRADSTSGWVQYRPNFRELQIEEGKNLYEKYRAYGRLEQRTLEAPHSSANGSSSTRSRRSSESTRHRFSSYCASSSPRASSRRRAEPGIDSRTRVSSATWRSEPRPRTARTSTAEFHDSCRRFRSPSPRSCFSCALTISPAAVSTRRPCSAFSKEPTSHATSTRWIGCASSTRRS